MGARIKRLTITEDEVQRQIVQGLTLLGYLVLVTTVRVRRCPHCGKPGPGRYGATKGVPDLLIRHPTWPARLWLAMECKRPGGQVRPEQRALSDAGAMVVVFSWEDALKAVQEVSW